MRVEPFAEADLTHDAMLGGKAMIRQPRVGYRAGTDPVLLAATIEAKPGQSVLELGCGAGPGLCCLGARVPGVQLYGIELQPAYAALARRNLSENGLGGTVWEGDLSAPPPEMRALSFHHVMANPPYFEAGRGIAAQDAGRGLGRAGETPLATWVAVAAKRLRPRGYMTFIQRAERLPELLAAMQAHVGALELLPLLPRPGRAPRLVLVRGRKDGKAAFRFHPPQVIHAPGEHEDGVNNYSEAFTKVMKHGAGLPFSE
ncbi:tRNA1(Val) (adenine(37)-N6)-methyltransferase [Tropicibacter naphthalenivorans]|uniref:tRNA1(Val) (adenine(37)-N6)-methyltransferase n=1 Tax=Tropicibacter naphthalenivorans TaxID=441103 RepID=UPI001F1B28D6|nr:methyltransferase [Tropicibacter naphthalenivorans]